MLKTLSLKTKMAIWVSLLFVIFIATLAWSTLEFFAREFKETISSQQFTLVSALATSIENKISIAQVALLGASTKITPGLVADRSRARHYLDSRPTLLSLFDEGTYLFDPEGTLIADDSRHDQFSHEKEDFFRQSCQKTVATRKPEISNYFNSAHQPGRPAILMTIPLFDTNGAVFAVMGGSINLYGNYLIEEISRIKIGKTGYLYLFDRNRTLIAHPDKSRILTEGAPRGVNKLFDLAVTGFEGSGVTTNSRGVEMLSSFKRLAAINWIIAANLPLSEAYAPLYQARNYFILATIIGTTAILLLVWLMMRRMTSQLKAMAQQVAALPALPEEEQCIAIDSKDEIGTLAHAFNDMVAVLGKQRAALVESENNFRALAETASDAMLVITGDGSFNYANCRIAQLTGYRTAELLQLGIVDLVHPDDLAQLMGLYRKIIAREQVPDQHETRIRRKDGSLVPVEISSSRTLWQGESADVVIIRNISESKRVEKELRDSYRLLRQTFASLNEAVFIVETGTRRFLDCNITAEKMFGYGRNEIIGATASLLHVTEEMSDWFGREMLRNYEGGGYFETTFKMKRKDGSAFDSEHFVTPIRDDNGGITSHVCVVRDISERKRVEKKILNLNHTLQRRAEELLTVNQELEAFSYSLSHDLKSPLAGIYAAAQALADGYDRHLDETGKFCVASICKSSERMEELIDAMLLLGRVAQSEVIHEEVDLSGLAKEILLRLQVENPERRGEHIIMPGVRVTGDARLLKSVMENLLGNAWKYTRKTPLARVEFGLTEHQGRPTCFVRDNGVGFDNAEASGIFLPFRRLHTPEEFEGTGIGLATVQRIISRHGGRIWAESAINEGATFSFTLPKEPPGEESHSS